MPPTETGGGTRTVANRAIYGASGSRRQCPRTIVGSLGDLVDDPRAQDAYDRVLDAMEAHELLPLLSVLSRRERAVLRARYGLDGPEQSISEIAERLGVSTSRVRGIEARALGKLRRAAAAVNLDR